MSDTNQHSRYASATAAVQGEGGCGAVSGDPIPQVCILDLGHAGPHGWEHSQHSEPDYSPAGTFEALRSEVARDPHRMSMMLSAPSARVLLDEYDRLRGVVETLTGRNQFLSTEQIRADLAEARIKELEEQLEAVTRERDDERGRFHRHVETMIEPKLLEQFDAAMDCMNYAWTIICNVSEGDWTKQRQEWQDAAARCRDQYHALLGSNPASEPEAS